MAIEKRIRHSLEPREKRDLLEYDPSTRSLGRVNDVANNRQRTSKKARLLLGEGATWTGKVNSCKSSDDFRLLFQEIGLPEEEWKTSSSFGQNGYKALYDAIIVRFHRWREFLKFMGQCVGRDFRTRLESCNTRNDFLSLFESEGITKNEWRNGTWLKNNGYYDLYSAICRNSQFQSFATFISYMDSARWIEAVRECETKEDFEHLFQKEGIPGNRWENTKWMSNNGFHELCSSIIFNKGFKNWINFLIFMQCNIPSETWKEKVKKCKSKKNFLLLFRDFGIEGDRWQSSQYLDKQGLGTLRAYIRNNPRFGTWNKFLKFMGIDRRFFTEMVAGCKSRDDFLGLFAAQGIPSSIWRRYEPFKKERNGLCQAIGNDPRFTSWRVFLACMDGFLPFAGIQDEAQARRLLEKEIRRLRSEVRWVTQLPQKAAITRQEIEELLSDKYYKRNGVSRAVADFYRAQEEQAES